MTEILDFAIRLHAQNPEWSTFCREVLAPGGIIDQNCSDRSDYEKTDEYRQLCKMFEDILETSMKSSEQELKEITLRVPKSLHEWLKIKAQQEGFRTLSKFVIKSLLRDTVREITNE